MKSRDDAQYTLGFHETTEGLLLQIGLDGNLIVGRLEVEGEAVLVCSSWNRGRSHFRAIQTIEFARSSSPGDLFEFGGGGKVPFIICKSQG